MTPEDLLLKHGINLPSYAPGRHACGSRTLENFFSERLIGEMVAAATIVDKLEAYARLDPELIAAIGGRELQSPCFDLSWRLESDRKRWLTWRRKRERQRACRRRRRERRREAERQRIRRELEFEEFVR